MTENSAIPTVPEVLDQSIFDMNTHAASTATTPNTCTPLLDTYHTSMLFDLYSRDGSTAYANACVPLSKLWDVQVETFP